MTERPAIRFLHDASAPSELVDSVQHGCEEEGVPLSIGEATGVAIAMARLAAAQSALFIGIAIDSRGAIAFHEQRLGNRSPLIHLSMPAPGDARLVGTIAGRFARGRPLPDLPMLSRSSQPRGESDASDRSG